MKKILMLLIAIASIFLLSGCQREVFGDYHHINRAAIQLPDGTTIQCNIEPWEDFRDDNDLQIKIMLDDSIYLIYTKGE